jgi:GNAT superfamily N-acetyltransferase
VEEQRFHVSPAGYEDLAKIKRLAIDHAHLRLSPARSLTLDDMRRIRSKDLDGLAELLKRENARIYRALDSRGALAGFVITMCAFEHCMTGQFQAEINELIVAPEFRRLGVGSLLVNQAERFAMSKGLSSLSMEVLSTNSQAHAFLEKKGYQEEVKIMTLTGFEPRQDEYADYPVRMAEARDYSTIQELALKAFHFSIPPHRQMDDELLRELLVQRLMAQCDPDRPGDAFHLVAETKNGDIVGFLYAEKEQDLFCNQLQLKLVNIAVREDYWGTKVAHALFNHFIKKGKQEAIACLSGIIATANRRSWLFFSRAWKVREERKLFYKEIGIRHRP